MLHLMKSKDKIFAKKRTLIQNFKDKKHKYVDVSIIHTTTQTPIILNIHLQVYQTLEPLEFLLTLHTLRSQQCHLWYKCAFCYSKLPESNKLSVPYFNIIDCHTAYHRYVFFFWSLTRQWQPKTSWLLVQMRYHQPRGDLWELKADLGGRISAYEYHVRLACVLTSRQIASCKLDRTTLWMS